MRFTKKTAELFQAALPLSNDLQVRCLELVSQEEGSFYWQNGLGTEEETGKMLHLECS
jgi:hypothetical protein